MMHNDTLLFCSLINHEIYIVEDICCIAEMILNNLIQDFHCYLRIIQGYLRKLLEVGLIATSEREPIAAPCFLNSALIILILRWAFFY